MLRSPTAAFAALLFPAVFDAPLLAQSDTVADWKPHGRFIASYRYSDWNPGSLIGADYETTGLNIAVLELDLEHRLQDTLFLPRLPRLRFEWTPENDELVSELNEAQFAASSDDPTAYFRLLGDIPLVELSFLDELIEDSLSTLDFDYERFAFASRITATQPRIFIPFEGGAQSLAAGDSVEGLTIFEKWTAELDVIFDLPDDTLDHSLDVGLFHLTYEKPYAVTLSGTVVDESIRASEFSATGLSLYYDARLKMSGSPNEKDGLYGIFGANIDFGFGDIEFANDQSIADFLEPTKSVHYYGLGLDAGMSWIAGPWSFDIGASYRYHTFEQADNVNGGSFSTFQVGELDINTDQVFFLSAGLSLVF